MKTQLTLIAANALLFASGLNAQITHRIQAHISHSFMIGKTSLPPGDYTFLMEQDRADTMTVSNDQTKKTIDFIVGRATVDRTPAHAQLVFRKYGDTEFLTKIFQGGEKIGVELTEGKGKEARVAGAYSEHIEEAK